MTEHNEAPRSYTEPKLGGAAWLIEERDPDTDEVTAEYGYPTESAAWAAYRMLTE